MANNEKDFKINIKADATQANQAINSTEKNLNNLNSTTTNNAKKSAGGLSSYVKNLSVGMIAAYGAVIAGVSKVYSAVKQYIGLYEVQAKAEIRLKNSVNGRIDIYDRLMKKAADMQASSSFGDEEYIANFAKYATTSNRTADELSKMADVAKNLAGVFGWDLNQAFKISNLALSGNVKALRKEMPEITDMIKKLSEEEIANGAILDLLNNQYKNFNKGVGELSASNIKKISNIVGDIKEKVGKTFSDILAKLLPTVKSLALFIDSFLSNFDKISEPFNKFFKIVKESYKNLGEFFKIFSSGAEDMNIGAMAAKGLELAFKILLAPTRALAELVLMFTEAIKNLGKWFTGIGFNIKSTTAILDKFGLSTIKTLEYLKTYFNIIKWILPGLLLVSSTINDEIDSAILNYKKAEVLGNAVVDNQLEINNLYKQQDELLAKFTKVKYKSLEEEEKYIAARNEIRKKTWEEDRLINEKNWETIKAKALAAGLTEADFYAEREKFRSEYYARKPKIEVFKSVIEEDTSGGKTKKDLEDKAKLYENYYDEIKKLKDEAFNDSLDDFQQEKNLIIQQYNDTLDLIKNEEIANKISFDEQMKNENISFEEKVKIGKSYDDFLKSASLYKIQLLEDRNAKELKLDIKKFNELKKIQKENDLEYLKNEQGLDEDRAKIDANNIRKRRKLEKTLVDIKKEYLNNELQILENFADNENLIGEERIAAEKAISDKILEIKRFENEQAIKESEDREGRLRTLRDEAFIAAQELIDMGFEIYQQNEEAKIELAKKTIDDTNAYEVEQTNNKYDLLNAGLEQQLQWEKITSEDAAAQKLNLENQKAEELKGIEQKKLFEQRKLEIQTMKNEKKSALWKVAIDGALAIAKTFAVYGFSPAGIIAAAAQAIATGAQAAIIQSKPIPTYAKGGYIDGPNHTNGGVMVNAEGGEYIVNKNSMKNPVVANTVQQINAGFVPNANIELISAIQNLKMYVAVDDINRVNNSVKVVEKRTNY